jgi:hypothetical protein
MYFKLTLNTDTLHLILDTSVHCYYICIAYKWEMFRHKCSASIRQKHVEDARVKANNGKLIIVVQVCVIQRQK